MQPKVMQYWVSVTNFRFSHSIFWKFSICAKKSMILPPTALVKRICWNHASATSCPATAQVVQVQHLVLQVEIQLPVEEPRQVLVYEEIRVVAPDVPSQMMLQVADRPPVVAPLMLRTGQGSRGFGIALHLLDDWGDRLCNDGLLLVAPAVGPRLAPFQGPVFEGNGDSIIARVPLRVRRAGYEEAPSRP